MRRQADLLLQFCHVRRILLSRGENLGKRCLHRCHPFHSCHSTISIDGHFYVKDSDHLAGDGQGGGVVGGHRGHRRLGERLVWSRLRRDASHNCPASGSKPSSKEGSGNQNGLLWPDGKRLVGPAALFANTQLPLVETAFVRQPIAASLTLIDGRHQQKLTATPNIKTEKGCWVIYH